MIDFHTHILPDIDDGSRDLDTSVKMLEEAYASGTECVVLTSHVYPRKERDIGIFLEKRKKSFDELLKACEGKDVPKMLLGGEVQVRSDFSRYERLEELCIQGTDYMLIEMPHTHWEEWVFESVFNTTLRGIKPIIAHVDRYMQVSKKSICALLELQPVFQVNSELFTTRHGRKVALELFNRGMIHILGSDMHDLNLRKNTLNQAYSKLEYNFGEEYLKFIVNNSNCILQNDEDIYRKNRFPKPKRIKFFI